MVKIAVLSEQGGRDYNEDSVSVFEKGRRQCVVAADGLGGHGGGKTASSIAAIRIKEAFSQMQKVDEAWISEVYQQVNQEVLDIQTAVCKMKTTCVSLFLEEGAAWWAHLGDSRLYYFREGALKMQTMDHSVSQMAALAGEITKEQIRFHEDRNRVLRAFGTSGRVRPDVRKMMLEDGVFHAFLLCTDGFWEYVLEEEMEIELLKTDEPSEWLNGMEGRLKKKATEKNDNYSAAAVFYYVEGEEK
ncbi:protein phosphatase 2C domain-containing protein [Lachnospiraceae bacterium 46-15]